MELVIDRQTWGRGQPETSALFNPQTHRQCCVGFYCEALGIPRRLISEVGTVSQLLESSPEQLETVPDWATISHLALEPFQRDIWELYGVNDDPELRDHERERQITELFAKHDVTVTFIN